MLGTRRGMPWIVVAVLVLFWTAPAETQFLARFTNPKVEVEMTHPPGFPLTLERAAVVPRGGECSGELVDAVISLFSEQGVELLDRENFEAILAEQDLGISGLVSPESAVEMGKLMGSAVLVMVNTQRCDEQERRSRESFKNIVTGQTGYKYIAKTEGFLKGSVRVVDLATGQIFASRPVEGRSVLVNTSHEGYPEFPSTYDARDGALRKAVTDVHRMFFPWHERKELYFFNDDECGLRSAFKLMEIDDVDGAAEQSAVNLEACKAAAVKPKFLARAYYNLGMARLLQSRYDEALELLGEAYRRDGGDIIAESIGEARRAKQLSTEMARLESSAELGTVVAASAAAPAPAAGVVPASAASGGGDPGSPESRLRKLDELLAKGLINREEYEKKRGQILSEI